jgi:uncharacterized membrane protein YgcG
MSHWLDRLAKEAAQRASPLDAAAVRPSSPEPVFTRRRGLQLATAASAAIALGPFRNLLFPTAGNAQPSLDCEGALFHCLDTASPEPIQILQCVLPFRPEPAEALLGTILSAAQCLVVFGLNVESKRSDCYDNFVNCSKHTTGGASGGYGGGGGGGGGAGGGGGGGFACPPGWVTCSTRVACPAGVCDTCAPPGSACCGVDNPQIYCPPTSHCCPNGAPCGSC